MAQVVKTDHDNLNATVTVTISPDDYLPKVDKELQKYRKNAQLKGFRKGKTPLNFIRKMHGKAILVEVINEILQDKLNKYLSEEKRNVIGQPLSAENQEELAFNISEKKDYVFSFDIGMAPEISMKGMDKKAKYDFMEVKVPDDIINETITDLRKRAGESASVGEDDTIQHKDIIAINAEELDGDKLKKDGWACTFNVMVDDITDEYRDDFMGKKKGDKVRFDIYALEANKDEEFVNKYLLEIQENDDNPEIGRMFEGVIDDISRQQEAEMNQEFFDKVFGEGKIKSEEEAKTFIAKQMGKQYESQTNGLLFREVQKKLIEQNKVDLPDAFLRRLIKSNNADVTDESLDKEFDKVKDNLRWSLIKGEVQKKFEIEVTDEMVLEAFKDRVRGYFGGYGDELIILNTANRLMEDKEQVNQIYEELISERVFESIKEQITLNTKSVTAEELQEKVREVENLMAGPDANPDIEEAEVEETVDVAAENE